MSSSTASYPRSTGSWPITAWDTALVVAHGAVNRAILSHALLGERMFLGRFEQAPGCINVLDVGRDRPLEWIVRAVNVAPSRPRAHRHAHDADGAVLGRVRSAPGSRYAIRPHAGRPVNEGEGVSALSPPPTSGLVGYEAFDVSHLSLDTGWKVPFVNLMIRTHWSGSWSAAPVFCRLPGRRNGFGWFQVR